MLQHLPAVVFGLSVFTIVANTAMNGRIEIFLGAVVCGIAAMAAISLKEKRDKGPPPSSEAEIQELTRERDTLRRSLDNARASGADDQIAFLEPRLAGIDARLKKLAR